MKVLAFDANSIVNRAFYGVRLLSTREGTYTNAVYGFFNIVYKLIEEQKPDAVAFAFDLHAPTFRHKMYEPYKGTRKGMPEELRQQMPLVKEMLRLLGYPILETEGYEADDILGSLARQGEKNGDTVLLCQQLEGRKASATCHHLVMQVIGGGNHDQVLQQAHALNARGQLGDGHARDGLAHVAARGAQHQPRQRNQNQVLGRVGSFQRGGLDGAGFGLGNGVHGVSPIE